MAALVDLAECNLAMRFDDVEWMRDDRGDGARGCAACLKSI